MNPEISVLKVSWPTVLSPTTIFTAGTCPCGSDTEPELYGRGVPGVGRWVGAGEGYTGTQPRPVPGPIFSILGYRPYPRPNEGYSEVSMRFPRYGPDRVQN